MSVKAEEGDCWENSLPSEKCIIPGDFFNFDFIRELWASDELATRENTKAYKEFIKFKESSIKKTKRMMDTVKNQPAKATNIFPNPEEAIRGYDIYLITSWWNYRYYYHYIPALKSHGFGFNQIAITQLCERLRDPLFKTDCNNFPDWRGKRDQEKWEFAYKIGLQAQKRKIENKKIMEMIDEIAAEAEAAKTD